jgi:hypothetical protein
MHVEICGSSLLIYPYLPEVHPCCAVLCCAVLCCAVLCCAACTWLTLTVLCMLHCRQKQKVRTLEALLSTLQVEVDQMTTENQVLKQQVGLVHGCGLGGGWVCGGWYMRGGEARIVVAAAHANMCMGIC